MTQTQQMTYTPSKISIEREYTDGEHETVLTMDLTRSDGETGDCWIVAGVPDWQRGSSDAAGHQRGFLDVWAFGDSLDSWLSPNFHGDDVPAIIAGVRDAALTTHQERLRAEAESEKVCAVEYVAAHEDDDDLDIDDLTRAFVALYRRQPQSTESDRISLWSLCCGAV
jgi:hypothetical protein